MILLLGVLTNREAGYLRLARCTGLGWCLMGRLCSICTHPNRAEIDEAIAAGTGFRGIARSFRSVTADSIGRHAVSHLPIAVIAAAEVVETERAVDLIGKVRGYITHAESILADAESTGKPTLALAALDRALACVNVLAKLTGDLDDRVTVNVLATTPEFVQLQSAIIAALAPYPDALEAVKLALRPAISA